jgi:hypothetical protein
MRDLFTLADRSVPLGSCSYEGPPTDRRRGLPAFLSCPIPGDRFTAVLQCHTGELQLYDNQNAKLVWDLPLSAGAGFGPVLGEHHKTEERTTEAETGAGYIELVYLVETDSLFVACLQGTISIVALPTLEALVDNDGDTFWVLASSEPTEEVIGTFDGGLSAALWAPDQSLLLVVCPGASAQDQPKAIVMTGPSSSFQVFSERELFEGVPDSLKHYCAPNLSRHKIAGVWREDTQFFALLLPSKGRADEEEQYQLFIYGQDGSFRAVGLKEDGSEVNGL